MGSTPQHPGYEEMKDTPWITQGREIADVGGKGILENYNKVNVFDEGTKKSLEARNNAVYQRAFDDMQRQYKDNMNRYAAANYGQFGTLNATPAAYRTDMYNLQAQRALDDLAYNKAVNYENLINNELQRRYNTLNMFGNLYGYGSVPYQQDVANWETRKKNADIAYENAKAKHSGLGSLLGTGLGAVQMGASYLPQISSALSGMNWGNLLGGNSGSSSSLIGQAINSNAMGTTPVSSSSIMDALTGSSSGNSALYDAIMGSTGGGLGSYTL